MALGLFIGLERERRGKEAGVRTFGFAALMGGLGGLLGEHGTISVQVARIGVVLNSLASTAFKLPLVARISGDRQLAM
ncbi:MAG: MgtC/SapB family protein, partial [Chloroflexi bacterium]|nr:MgtC/SapB family protein [Chloroflexota bacterium]